MVNICSCEGLMKRISLIVRSCWYWLELPVSVRYQRKDPQGVNTVLSSANSWQKKSFIFEPFYLILTKRSNSIISMIINIREGGSQGWPVTCEGLLAKQTGCSLVCSLLFTTLLKPSVSYSKRKKAFSQKKASVPCKTESSVRHTRVRFCLTKPIKH